MIILLDTSSPICKSYWITNDEISEEAWEANRQLADDLLGYLRRQLAKRNATWKDITGIGVNQGPGSFTGLRIGLTVMNTIADDLKVPIVGASGDDWVDTVQKRLASGEDDSLVMPLYGRDANITKPRK